MKTVLTTIHNVPVYERKMIYLPYNPNLKFLLKDKRKARVLSEVLFWLQVHKRKFHQIDFDRQRIIGNYIVDFYVKRLGLVVEIDGSSHIGKEEYDRIRIQYFESLGLKVFVATDWDVRERIDNVMYSLEGFILEHFGE